jgi:hypothetical protein
MIDSGGRYICDAEIKTRRFGFLPPVNWRGCKRPATIAGDSRVVARLELHYCNRHKGRAYNGRKIATGVTP